MTDKVQAKVYLPEDAKAMIDADKRSNSEVVEAAIWDFYGDQSKGALQTRLENKRDQLEAAKNTLETEKENVEGLEKTVKRLERQIEEAKETPSPQREKWLRKVRMVPQEPEHPVVQDAAEKLDMEPEAVITEAYE